MFLLSVLTFKKHAILVISGYDANKDSMTVVSDSCRHSLYLYDDLECPGYRFGRCRQCKSRVGIQHRVTKDDAMKWFQVKYEGVTLNQIAEYWGLGLGHCSVFFLL
ncbi:hypothetical protein Vadar_014415 [Vaccinium darrowii]|uniref:Uncharacterized protein n=1 Tax=Vaccinium darrowii TaxID=229202 RepID=A0ACB7XQM7_9ERIC|nr:hypothetical protein Vadar_014415 [Vaccinium darrowii]